MKQNASISPFQDNGEQLQSASEEYNIPLDDWVDLSTCTSPFVASKHALQNSDEQQQQERLSKLALRLEQLLEDIIFTKPLLNGGVYFNTPQVHVQSTALFSYFLHPQANIIHHKLAQQGILTRLFDDPLALRFGLPKTKDEWQRLGKSLDAI